MSDEFNYRLQRSRTRESSTLTIATVAASASLVLLTLYLQEQIEMEIDLDKLPIPSHYTTWIPIMGSLFAIFGVAYRDVTALTIQRNDECFLSTSICRLRDNRIQAITRAIILHVLLFIPIVAWLFVIYPTLNILTIVTIIGVSICIALISGYEATDPCLSRREAFRQIFRPRR